MALRASLEIEADLKGLRSEIGKIPGLTAEKAEQMVIALEKRFLKAEAAAKATAKAIKGANEKAARDAEKAAKDAAKALEQEMARSFNAVERASDKLSGGLAGDVKDYADGLKGLVATLGPVGAMGAGAAAGIGLVTAGAIAGAVAAWRFVDSADEALDRLKGFSGVEPLPLETIERLDQWERSATAADVATDRLTVLMAGGFADAFGEAPTTLVGLIDRTADLVERMDALHDRVEGFLTPAIRGLTAAATLGISEIGRFAWGLNGVSEQGAEMAAAVREVTDEVSDLADEADIAGPTLADLAEGGRKLAEARRLAADAARIEAENAAFVNDALKVEQQARDELARLIADTTADTLTAEAKIQAAYQERVDSILLAATKSEEWAKANEGLAAAEARRQRDLMALDSERMKALGDQASASLDEIIAIGEGIEEGLRQIVADYMADVQAMLDAASIAFGAVANLVTTLNDNRINALEEEVTAAKEAEQKKLDAWMEAEEAKVEAKLESGKISEKQAILERQRIEEERKARQRAIRQMGKAEEDQALKAFKMNKGIQIAQATIEAARAAISLIPAFALLGPAAPFAAAGVAAAGLAAQIATIEAQAPPEFPMGKLPGGSGDHPVAARIREDEAVLTGRGVRTAGGRDGVAALNAGQGGGGGVVNLQIDRRTVASVLLDAAGTAFLQPTPGSWAAGKRPLYGRR